MLWQVLAEFARQHPGVLVANLGMMAFTPISDVYLPHLYGELVDKIEKGLDIKSLVFYIVLVLLVVQLGYFLRDYLDTKLIPQMENITRDIILQRIIAKYEQNYTEVNSGEVISKIINAPFIIRGWFGLMNDYIIPYVVVFAVSIVYFMFYDVWIALFIAIFIALIVIVFVTLPRRCNDVSSQREQAYNNLYEQFDEIFRNMASVYGCEQQEQEQERMERMGAEYNNVYSATMRCTLWCKSLSTPLVMVFFVAFVWRCHYLIKTGRLDVAKFTSLFMIITFMLTNIIWIINLMRSQIFDLGTMRNIDEYLKNPLPTSPSVDALGRALPPFTDRLGMENVTFFHKAGDAPILENASVSFEPGQRTVVTGAIGSGKSTLLKLIMRFFTPVEGDLYLQGGKWYSGMSTRDVRRRVGYVPQEPILFNRSILDNILYGNKNLTENQVVDIMKTLGVYNDFAAFPEGLHTRVGKAGQRLSGGQRQLVWCLRVILRDPDVIVMDEPTASMDDRTKQVLARLLRVASESHGKTIIMVTHDDFLKKLATRRVHVENKRIHAV